MLQMKVHKSVQRIIEFLYRTSFWNRHDDETFGQKTLKIFYSIYYSLAIISMVVGAVTTENNNERIMLAETGIMTVVFIVKLLYLIWRKKEILELLNQLCCYWVDDRDTFISINDKLNNFMKFLTALSAFACLCLFCETFVAPFVGKEKTIFFPIAFPLDWRHNEFAYWMAFTFLGTAMAMTAISLLFSMILWYLMANCSWRYDALGQEMKKMGEMQLDDESADVRDIYCQELARVIKSHSHLKEYVAKEEITFFLKICVTFVQVDGQTGFIHDGVICGSIGNQWTDYLYVNLFDHTR